MRSCPRCGSSSRVISAPGHWKCVGTVESLDHVAVIPPGGPGNPGPHSVPINVSASSRSCEHVYPVAPEELTSTERAENEAFRRQTRHRQITVERWRTEIALPALRALPDPTSRLMAVVGNWGRDGLTVAGLFENEDLGGLSAHPPWDHDALEAWFRNAATAPATDLSPTVVRRGPFRRRPKGWVFAKGCVVESNAEWAPSITIFEQTGRSGPGFNFAALEQMAGRATFARLPPAPPLTDRQSRTPRGSATSELEAIMAARGLRTGKL